MSPSLPRIALAVGLVAIAWGGWRLIEARRYREDRARAERDLAEGRHAQARRRLIDLAARRPGDADAAEMLARCEEALGHPDAAMEAWSRIGPDSPAYRRASVARARLLIRTGRLRRAEEILERLPRGPEPDGVAVREAYEHLLRLEGRIQEARTLIVESWRGAADPATVLKRLYILDDDAFPLDYVKDILQRGDPQDDRVWLGRANIATWQGHFDEADRWLDACEGRHPDDQAVWLGRLALATARRDPGEAARAVRHLSSSLFTPAEVLRLRRWFAELGRDRRAERDCLLALVEQEPGSVSAWSRLAELALAEGREKEAEDDRRRQVASLDLREEYAHLLMGNDPDGHAAELSQIAGKLGRRFEARGWALIDRGRAAVEPLAGDASGEKAAGSLSDALAGVLLEPGDGKDAPPRVAAKVPTFVDDAEAAGLRFFHENGHDGVGTPPPPEAMCGGVGLLDYDGDGWLDSYVVQAGTFPPTGAAPGAGDRLFRNRGDGTFEDATARAGLDRFATGYGHGVTVGDYDGDGRPDLFVTRWRAYALYRNRGDGTFEDATQRAGLGGDRDWPTSAVLADLDADGDLDLYVCHYLEYDPDHPRRCPHGPGSDYCMPRDYPALRDHAFRNDGGRFVDVTAEAGFVDPDGRGLGVLAADLDDDNRIDLFVANDMSANDLFRNLGGFRFEETGQLSGLASSSDGLYKSGMGIACGDLDGDLALDLSVTNFYGESTSFFRNIGHGLFVDQTAAIGLLAPSRPLLGFGAAFADLNNDGWLDLITTNGHVLDARPTIPFTMPLQLMVGSPGGRLADVGDRAGEAFREPHLGRGLAVGDLDNDGRLDVLVINQNQPMVYLHNRTDGPAHFVRFSLEGTRSNRDAVGARVTIDAGGRRRMAERVGGGSYQSSNDPRLHFGLGDAARVDAVEVRWPSGRVDRHGPLAVDREYHLREGDHPASKEPRKGKTSKGP